MQDENRSVFDERKKWFLLDIKILIILHVPFDSENIITGVLKYILWMMIIYLFINLVYGCSKEFEDHTHLPLNDLL